MRHSVPSPPAAIVSCHLEQPLRDDAWERFAALRRRRPGGFDVIALMRPPDAAHGEDVERWLERAHAAASEGPFGLHTHWTSPTHARPTGGDPAQRVRSETEWMRAQGLEPRFFCGGGWYTDDSVRETVQALGLVDCTERGGAPAAGLLPTTHSLGMLARALLRPPLPEYVHAYFHDYDLVDPLRRGVLDASLRVLGRRRPQLDPFAVSAASGP
jgi:hypothetical protein